MADFWEIVEERRKKLAISRAEMARRAGISESTVTYGLKRKTKPIPSVRRQVEQVLAEESGSQGAAA